ncbi:MAG TPA: shikimate dehydrogenase [Beijerinckiaceae bacterium]|nr:shikimate dehydrogenase [Methylobacteriaceae bacterium]MCC0001482.1 shikimate dehydrogenase [Methylobacteriaceae bacterium]HRY03559.1 shikimate dehydrogenase [Beijerinckiaceae bacterium]
MSHPATFRLAGVMGWPVMHSRSPRLHNSWMRRYGVSGYYAPLPVEPGRLEAALRALPALNFAGCNVTLPHKEDIVRIADHVDPAAKAIGAANCVVVLEDGSLAAFNYDVFGFMEALRAQAPGWRAAQGPAVVLGAGGAARAIVYGLIADGAPEVRVVNRTFERAQAFADEFGAAVKPLRWDERSEALAGSALLVNTTSNGMVGQPPLDISLDALARNALVNDIVYTPLETPLLAAARVRGNVAVDGLGMLIQQARPAFHDWFGIMPDVTADERAMMEPG